MPQVSMENIIENNPMTKPITNNDKIYQKFKK